MPFNLPEALTEIGTDIKGLNQSKANASHTHAIGDVTNLQATLNGKASTSHTHAIADVTNLQTTLNGKAPTSHTHAIGDISNLQTTLNGKAPTSHTHTAADISNSTAAGRSLLTAANAGSQRTALEIELDYLEIYTEARDAV